jgi:hypothetical protein
MLTAHVNELRDAYHAARSRVQEDGRSFTQANGGVQDERPPAQGDTNGFTSIADPATGVELDHWLSIKDSDFARLGYCQPGDFRAECLHDVNEKGYPAPSEWEEGFVAEFLQWAKSCELSRLKARATAG